MIIPDWIVFDYYGVIDLDGRGSYNHELIKLINFLGKKHQIAIASNSYLTTLQSALQTAGLSSVVSKIIASSVLKVSKPDLDFWKLAADVLGSEASKILLIDDRPDNVKSAQSTGWQAINYQGVSQLIKELGLVGVNTGHA